MIIAVTATAPDLEAEIDPRFGRSPYFLIVNTDNLSCEAVENPNLKLTGGAGTQSASLMAKHGVTHVLTGNCGPNGNKGAEGPSKTTSVVRISSARASATSAFLRGQKSGALLISPVQACPWQNTHCTSPMSGSSLSVTGFSDPYSILDLATICRTRSILE